MPPASVVQAVQASNASSTATDATPTKNIGDVPAPSKPTGPLITDGTQTTVMNTHPGWRMVRLQRPPSGGVILRRTG